VSDEASTVPKVKRMGTRYVPEQDRFRLAAEMEDGEVHAMWMTQRLLRLSLGPLATYFEQTKPPSPEQVARRSYVELIHKVSGKAGPPVASIEPSHEWLIASVDIRFQAPTIYFVFKGEAAESANMEMDSLKLRKWLGILYRKSVKGGWPESMWPPTVVAALDME
jgi:hypothetical protein